MTGWLSTRPIDVLDLRLPPTWGAVSTLKTGEVLRMEDDWRAYFNGELFSLGGMAIDWFDAICLKIFL